MSNPRIRELSDTGKCDNCKQPVGEGFFICACGKTFCNACDWRHDCPIGKRKKKKA
jgi:hypothetical protein